METTTYKGSKAEALDAIHDDLAKVYQGLMWAMNSISLLKNREGTSRDLDTQGITEKWNRVKAEMERVRRALSELPEP